MRRAASERSSTESMRSMPESAIDSKWFGVTNVASGRMRSLSALSVSSAAPGSCPLQIRTGSRTTCRQGRALSASATTSGVAPSGPSSSTRAPITTCRGTTMISREAATSGGRPDRSGLRSGAQRGSMRSAGSA